MDPQVKSLLTTIAGYFATGLATWATGVGVIPAEDKTSFANIVVSIALWTVAAGIAEYKRRSQSKDAMIKAVSAADNGVNVVKAGTGGLVVNAALK